MIYIVRMKSADDDSAYANAYNSLEESKKAVRKIKESIRDPGNITRWFHGYNSYTLTVDNVEICTVDILSLNKKDVEFHLTKCVDGEWVDTRRFSSRENAVNFVHHILDVNNYQVEAGEDANGVWDFQDEAGVKVQYRVFLAIYKRHQKTIKTNEYSEILGVNPGVSDEEVKKAYRQKSKIHHPDRGGNMQDFLKIQEAYENLINGLGGANKETFSRELSEFCACVEFEQGHVESGQEFNHSQRQNNYRIIDGIVKFIFMIPVMFCGILLLRLFTGNNPFEKMEVTFFASIFFAAIEAIREVAGVDVSNAIKGRPLKK